MCDKKVKCVIRRPVYTLTYICNIYICISISYLLLNKYEELFLADDRVLLRARQCALRSQRSHCCHCLPRCIVQHSAHSSTTLFQDNSTPTSYTLISSPRFSSHVALNFNSEVKVKNRPNIALATLPLFIEELYDFDLYTLY